MAGLDPAIHHCSKTVELLANAWEVPSPLVGEGGAIERSEMKPGEGYLSAGSSVERTPHPALRATFSHKGRRVEEQEMTA
jgi:hypothetical protein